MRLAHFTDIHVTAEPRAIPWRALLSKRLIGWLNLRLRGRFEVFAEAARVTEACVADLLQQQVDHVIVTGDYTGMSLETEFAAATRAVNPLLAADIPITTLPGNHDVYVRSAVREQSFERFFGHWIRSDLPVAVDQDGGAGQYPLVRFLGDDAVLIALRDARPRAWHDSSGQLGDSQFERFEALLGDPRIAGHTKIVALHYGLRRAGGEPDTRLHGLAEAERFLQLAATGGVALVIHGHLHGRFVHRAGSVSPVAIANPGSLTARGRARAYHVYTVEGPEIHLEARRYDETLGEFTAWPDAPGSGEVTAHPT
jgi:3',5'-cyclic AMP phosphodiesterase CpdA